MLQSREILPEFSVITARGDRFSSGEIWHKRNLVLVVLGAVPGPADEAYVAQLDAGLVPSLGEHTSLVVTRERVAGEEGPLALVADKWGEIYYLSRVDAVAALPPARELDDWLTYIRIRCSG